MDFSTLKDKELLSFIQDAMAEAISRKAAVREAALDIQEESQEKAQSIFNSQVRESEKNKLKKQAERTKRIWAYKKAIAEALKLWGWPQDSKWAWKLTVWSREADIRVYFENINSPNWKVDFYVTGNDYQPPEKLILSELSKLDESHPLSTEQGRTQFKAFLKRVSEIWGPKEPSRIGGANFRLESVDLIDLSSEPEPNHLASYRRSLEIPQEPLC